jgi:hypothetical protein
MKIKKVLSVGHIGEKIKHSDYTKDLSGDERISLLEELRYDLGKFLGYDYSGRFKRFLSVVERKPG